MLAIQNRITEVAVFFRQNTGNNCGVRRMGFTRENGLAALGPDAGPNQIADIGEWNSGIFKLVCGSAVDGDENHVPRLRLGQNQRQQTAQDSPA